jgi:hypothetical protein
MPLRFAANNIVHALTGASWRSHAQPCSRSVGAISAASSIAKQITRIDLIDFGRFGRSSRCADPSNSRVFPFVILSDLASNIPCNLNLRRWNP